MKSKLKNFGYFMDCVLFEKSCKLTRLTGISFYVDRKYMG